MSNVIAENDEPIHHSEGKTILRFCPSELTSALSGESSPLITISPPVIISPPDLLRVLEQRKLEQDEHHGKLKNFLRSFFFFKKYRKKVSSDNRYYIERLTLEVSNNFYNKTTRDNMINNITAFYCVIMNNDNVSEKNSNKNEQSNENEAKESSDDVESSEVVEVMEADESLTIDNYIAEKENVQHTKNWLHLMIDKFDKPKEKLIFPRALSEGGVFTRELPHKIYEKEFGPMAKSSYRDWMMLPLRYKQDEIDKIIEQYLQYLAKFRK